MTAKDWNDFLAAMRRWGAPSENQVYADTKGNIGWVAAGRTPRRVNYDGLDAGARRRPLRVAGVLVADESAKDLPAEPGLVRDRQPDEPAARIIRSTERKVGFEWADSARWQRIVEVLSANSKMTLADAMDLQNDDTAMLARRLLALAQAANSDDANVQKGLALLRNGMRATPSTAQPPPCSRCGSPTIWRRRC